MGNLVYKAAVVTIIKLVLLKPHLRRGITFNAFIIIIGGLGPLHRLKREDYHIIKGWTGLQPHSTNGNGTWEDVVSCLMWWRYIILGYDVIIKNATQILRKVNFVDADYKIMIHATTRVIKPNKCNPL